MPDNDPIPVRRPKEGPLHPGDRFRRYKERHRKEEDSLPIYDGGGGDDGGMDCFGKYNDPDAPECQVCVLFNECKVSMGTNPIPIAPLPPTVPFNREQPKLNTKSVEFHILREATKIAREKRKKDKLKTKRRKHVRKNEGGSGREVPADQDPTPESSPQRVR